MTRVLGTCQQLIQRLQSVGSLREGNSKLKKLIQLANRRVNLLLVIAAFVIALLGYLSPDKIDINGGFGWDGILYGELAQNFYERLKDVKPYFMQRILPSALIYYALRLFSIEPINANVIHAFGILNVFLITLMAYVWGLVADELKIGVRGKWLGFIGLFLNYGVLKWASYYSVLTDIPGYALGLFLLYFHLIRSSGGLIITTAVGAFTWPTSTYLGILLLLFSRKSSDRQDILPVPYRLNTVIALAVVIYMYWVIHPLLRFPEQESIKLGINEPLVPALGLSVVVSLVYLFLSSHRVLADGKLFSPAVLLPYLKEKTFYISIALLMAIRFLQGLLVQGKAVGLELSLEIVVWCSIIQPGSFLVNHVMFFGPIVILAIFLWDQICQIVHEHGVGLTLCITLGVMMGLLSESRGLFNFFPFFIPFIVKAADSLTWQPLHYWLFAFASVLISKVWFTIGPLESGIPPLILIGPWMPHSMYFLQGAAVLVLSVLMYVFYVRQRQIQKA